MFWILYLLWPRRHRTKLTQRTDNAVVWVMLLCVIAIILACIYWPILVAIAVIGSLWWSAEHMKENNARAKR